MQPRSLFFSFFFPPIITITEVLKLLSSCQFPANAENVATNCLSPGNMGDQRDAQDGHLDQRM